MICTRKWMSFFCMMSSEGDKNWCLALFCELGIEKGYFIYKEPLGIRLPSAEKEILVRDLQAWTKYLRQTLLFMWNSALRENLNSYFLLVSMKSLFWEGDLALAYNYMKFWDFPGLSLFSKISSLRWATHEETRIYHVYY